MQCFGTGACATISDFPSAGWRAADDPVTFVKIRVGRDPRGTTMRGAVEPSVAAEIKPAVNLSPACSGRPEVAVTASHQQADGTVWLLDRIRKRRHSPARDDRPRQRNISHLPQDCRPRRTIRISWIVLPWKKCEVYGRCRLRDGHSCGKSSGRLQKLRRAFRDARHSMRKPRWEGDISEFVRSKSSNGKQRQQPGVKQRVFHGCSTVRI